MYLEAKFLNDNDSVTSILGKGAEYEYHLVDVVFLYGEVKHGVEIVEEVHHFHRGTLGGQAGKAHYVREVDGHRLVQFGLDKLAFLQFVRYNACETNAIYCINFEVCSRCSYSYFC